MGRSISMGQESNSGKIDQEMQDELIQELLRELEDQTIEELLINQEISEDSSFSSQAGLKPLSEEPPKLELKTLPSHLEYAFLESDLRLQMIIASNLDKSQKDKLLEMLKQHNKAIAWKITNIRGISPVVSHSQNSHGRRCQAKSLTAKKIKPKHVGSGKG